jgi:hypothetical protein
MVWTCRKCGATHTGTPDSYSYEAPWPWYTIPEAERDARSLLTEDYCAIDSEDFFVRGCLEVPIIGRDSPLLWCVWVSLSRENYFRERSLAEDPRRTAEQPYFGWLSSRIEIYPDTAALKTNVRTQPVGKRPLIELEPTDHPLAVEQRTGISEARLMEIAELMEHGWKHPRWSENQF